MIKYLKDGDLPKTNRERILIEEDLLRSSGYTKEEIEELETEDYDFLVSLKYYEKYKRLKAAEKNPFANI